MFTVELYAAIRRAVMIEGLSRREAARRFGVHRNTITKMIQYSAPPGYRRRERPVSKKLGPYMAWIDKVLADDRSVHKKQRHTAQRIFERLRDEEAFSGGYTIVREYVAQPLLRSRERPVTVRFHFRRCLIGLKYEPLSGSYFMTLVCAPPFFAQLNFKSLGDRVATLLSLISKLADRDPVVSPAST